MKDATTTRKTSKLRRVLLVLLVLILGLVSFHIVENYRGNRAWEAAKARVEAKGFIWDWERLKPKPVPADQNVMGDAQVHAWFKRDPKSKQPAFQFGLPPRVSDTTVAEVILLSAGEAPPPGSVVYSWEDLAAHKQTVDMELWLRRWNRSLMSPFNYRIVPPDSPALAPVQIYVRGAGTNFATAMPGLLGRAAKLVKSPDKPFVYLVQEQPFTATDYLAQTDAVKPQLEQIRKALAKPFAQLSGDYSQAMACPIYNFVTMRSLAQLLATRAQCHLLQGQPAAAAVELDMLQQVSALNTKPGQPAYLVSTMIGVAIEGLHVAVVADGFRLGLWQPAQRAQFQAYFQRLNLLRSLHDSINAERAGLCQYAMSQMRDGDYFDIIGGGNLDLPAWLRRSAGKALFPEGWAKQNAAVVADYLIWIQDPIEARACAMNPMQLEAATRQVAQQAERKSPFQLLASIGLPNYTKASQATCRNQDLAGMAVIACALEQHREAAGAYPATLAALVPRYLDKLPADVLTGQPMKYQPTPDGRYRLYSVGWNLKDEDGADGHDNTISARDWVWPGVPEKTK